MFLTQKNVSLKLLNVNPPPQLQIPSAAHVDTG